MGDVDMLADTGPDSSTAVAPPPVPPAATARSTPGAAPTDAAAACGAGAGAGAGTGNSGTVPAAVEANGLTLDINGSVILRDVSFKLQPGDRCLVLGANGAGKTTLLRTFAGRHRHVEEQARLQGRSCYYDSTLNLKRAFLGTDWGTRTVAFSGFGQLSQSDVAARDIMKREQAKYAERRDMLVKMLDMDLDWRLHAVSDGQRRRVQIMAQLLRPVDVVLMDEVTTGLDVVSRSDFLAFMKDECETRGVTCMYATHVFDGMDDWATHVLYLMNGRVTRFSKVEDIKELRELKAAGVTSPMYRLVELWMRQDKATGKLRAQLGHAPVAALADPTSMAAGLGNGFLAGRMVRKMYPVE